MPDSSPDNRTEAAPRERHSPLCKAVDTDFANFALKTAPKAHCFIRLVFAHGISLDPYVSTRYSHFSGQFRFVKNAFSSPFHP
jgi:hypothetical protein